MIANKEIEPLEKSSVKLTVTVKKDTVAEAYDKLIKKYSKTAQIKGFRKGHVPPKILEQKYGDAIKEETLFNLIEESLQKAIEEVDKKPLPYATPELQDPKEPKLDLSQDFVFSVKYDTFPEISLGQYKEHEIEVPKVKIEDDDEKQELETLREQNAIVTEKKEGLIEKDDIVTINYWEVDDDNIEIADTKREDFVFTLGSGYNFYQLDDDVIGMNLNEERIIEKEYPEDHEREELAGRKIKIGVKVTKIKTKELPALDDELAQDISEDYETLDDLRKDIKKRLQEKTENRLRELKTEQLFDNIIKASPIDLPESMIKAELENSWQRFVSQLRMPEEQVLQLLNLQGKNRESYMEEWRPKAERTLHVQLLLNKISEQENIQVMDEELDQEIVNQARESNQEYDKVREYLEQNNMLEYIKSELISRKTIDFLLEQSKVKEGESITYLDLMKKNQ